MTDMDMDRSARVEQMRQKYRNGKGQDTEGQPPREQMDLRQLAFFPLAIFYMELVLRQWSAHYFFGLRLIYVLLFSFAVGMVCNLIVSLGPDHIRRKVHVATLIVITIIFLIQIGFYGIFRSYAGMAQLSVAQDAVTDFFMESLRTIGSAALPMLLTLLPLALFQALGLWKKRPIQSTNGLIRASVVMVALHVVAISSVLLNTYGLAPVSSLYREHFTLDRAVPTFGLITGLRLDVQYSLFGHPEIDVSELLYVTVTPTPAPTPTEPDDPYEEPEPIVFGYNVLDIDFEALRETETNQQVREMHEFFMNRRPTPQNEWTGRFEGYNLILFMGEAFHTLAIHPEITPTIYRMFNEGFQFTNFYTPDTGFSTTGGEFAMMTSLIPRHVNAFPNTARMYMPFAFGNMFQAEGVGTFAYHNWTYSFYRRDLSHPNMGYIWRALGNGLPITRMWPTSDLEMIEVSVDDFINLDRFHVYYVTVSGHLEYNFGGNAMAHRHQDAVAHLPYSLGPRAYLATHIELELALAYLIERLDEVGQLERTVFAIIPDHYPYGLSVAEMEELGGAPLLDPLIDVHHSAFILWSASMTEPIVVDTFGSFYDVLPTIANLFAFPFDSRLLMGVDLLSGADAFVPFASRSWVSQLGRFNSRTGQFTPHPHIDPELIPEDHPEQMMARFNLLEVFSVRILEHDYYRRVLGNQ